MVKTEVVQGLLGNTEISKASRLATGSFNPQRNAVWTLADLDVKLERYLFQVHNKVPDARFGIPPEQLLAQSLKQTGARPSTAIAFDHAFLISTAPTTHKGTARVGAQGVKIGGIRYWCSEFADPDVRGSNVEVRHEPLNCGLAYAKVRGEWRECHSRFVAQFADRTRKEIAYYSVELRKRLRARPASELDLAAFIEHDVAPTEDRLHEERRAAERRAAAEQRALRLVGADSGIPLAPSDDTDSVWDAEEFPRIPRGQLLGLPRDEVSQ